jgi:hypothetical protein
VWDGIHFRSADVAGALIGVDVANWAVDHCFAPTNSIRDLDERWGLWPRRSSSPARSSASGDPAQFLGMNRSKPKA